MTTLDYLHPPITEAVIEVKIKNSISKENLEKIAKKLQLSYPNKELVNNLDINIKQQPEGNGSLNLNTRVNGYSLTSDDQTNKVIILSNSIAAIQLAPYQGWEQVKEKFTSAWKHWKKTSKTQEVSRIGIRNINRIDIPSINIDRINLEEYLTFNPKVPKFSNSPITRYLMQVSQPISDLWSVNITSTGIQSPLINHTSLLLDIDVFRTDNIPLNDVDLWKTIDEARDIKNKIFKACITQKTEELFR